MMYLSGGNGCQAEMSLSHLSRFCPIYYLYNLYCIAGNFGGELNVAVWRSVLQPPN